MHYSECFGEFEITRGREGGSEGEKPEPSPISNESREVGEIAREKHGMDCRLPSSLMFHLLHTSLNSYVKHMRDLFILMRHSDEHNLAAPIGRTLATRPAR